MRKVALLPGDGIGPEIIAAAVTVIQSVTDKLEFEYADVGAKCFKDCGDYLPRSTIDIVDGSNAVLFGTIDAPVNDRRYRSPLEAMSKRFELHSNVRNFFKLSNDMGTGDINSFLVTENTDANDPIIETETLDGVSAERYTTASACKRLFKTGRMVAEINRINLLTLAHDGDFMKATRNLVLSEFRSVMTGAMMQTQELPYTEVIRTFMTAPKSFEFIIATGLRAELIDSVMSTIAGRKTTMTVASVGEKGIFRPDHGPMTELAGLNRANPTAMILAGGAMLEFMGIREGRLVREAVKKAYNLGYRTADLGGNMGLYEFTDKVISLCIDSA
jgi:isocitrate/isopropylmalate dehydrogenase